MKILVDVASIAKRAFYAGKDTENGTYAYDAETGKETLINSAQYGYDNLANSMASLLNTLGINPKDMVLVLEGVGSLQNRKTIYAGYKAGREKPEGFYREYNKMLGMFLTDMLALGAQTAECDGLEADDLIAWFCETLTEDNLLVVTNDHDLLALAKYDHVDVFSNGEINPKPYGDFPYEFIDVYKATVGDSSDKIPGAKGFGPKAFAALYAQFGDNGLRVLRKLIQGRNLISLQEDVAELPALQKIIDYAMDVERSLKLARFATHGVTPDTIIWKHGVNTGASQHPLLKPWSQTITGVTAANFQAAFDQIKQLSASSDEIALDIETSTSEESDEWLFEIKGKEGVGVDVFGSELTGMSLTLGSNFQHTFYFSIDHADTDNCSLAQIESLLQYLDPIHRFVIQNVNFELPVLFNTFGWFLRDVDDTKLMASYVDENSSLGLKQNSKRWLGYEQASYADTVTDAEGRQRKMNELTLAEVLHYGADDTICTAALYQWYQLHMMLEGVWQTYRDVEIGAAYWTAQAFVDGVHIDLPALSAMIARDTQAKAEQETTLHKYLIQVGWDGTVFEAATADTWQTPAWIKYAFLIVTGKELETQVRRVERLIFAVREQGSEGLASALETGDVDKINTFVRAHFKAAPVFNAGSPKQMQQLMYQVMGLPVRLRNKPTDLMREKNQEGTAQTDELAISSALHYDLSETDEERRTALESLLKIKMYNTREGLYYKTYPHLCHWKDNRIHAGLNQCATVTRRFSSSQPKLNWALCQ